MKNDVTIIITSYSNKKYILKKLSDDGKLCNLKFYTFLDLKKKLYFDYNNKTLEYVMKKYKVCFNVAKIYVEHLYFLKDINNEKVMFLNSLKEDLDSEGLLIYDDNFRTYIQNKRIVLYGYNNLKKEEKLIIKELGEVIKYSEGKKVYTPLVFQLKDEKEEVEYVFNRISKLYLDGVSLNKIKIIVSSEYTSLIKTYSSIYNIPVELMKSHSFYSTKVAQDFLNNYETLEIEDNVLELKEKYKDINDFITILNKSVLVSDKRIRKEFIINDLKKYKLKESTYQESVKDSNLDDYFGDSEYVFLLGFHIGSYPNIFKDDDYLSDLELEELGLDTSYDRNIYEANKIKEKIKSIKNLVITCRKSDNKTIFPSLLIEEMNLDVKEVSNNPQVAYSKLNTKLRYAKELDNLYKFNIVGDNLGLYRFNMTIPYLEYSNIFNGINKSNLKKRLESKLTLAYTNMEMYNECAFKYYISKILKIDMMEESFKIIVGMVTHHILELGLEKEINIPIEIIKFVKEKDYILSSKDYFYLEKLSGELEFILETINKQNEVSSLKNNLFESELYVYLDKEDVNITFKGLIDKIMFMENDGKEVLAVVDYKTGNTNITLDNLEYGLNIQLPIYLYLLKSSDRFKDADIAGFYIQKVLGSIPNQNDKKSLKEIKEENLRLQGYSNISNTIISLLDRDYQDSKVIKGLRYKKDGNLYSSAKVLSSKQMDEITNIVGRKIDECISNILDGDFSINPKVIKGVNVACQYCNFKDVCFKTKNDEVVLGGEEDEMDKGTVSSD